MGSCEALFLQMKPHLISHLKLVWPPYVDHGITCTWCWLLQNIMNFLLDILDFLNKFGFSIDLSVRGVYPLFLDGRFGNGVGSVGLDILADMLSKLWIIIFCL
jgi:hypothetical protein